MLRIISIIAAVLFFAPTTAKADVIHGCIRLTSGRLRLVADPGQCREDREAAVSWNSEGPQGSAGPQGPQGEQGPPGEAAVAPPRFELVGFTAATFQGDTGVFGFTLGCQAEFPDSRMCTSKEAIETVNVPNDLAGQGQAWIMPVQAGTTNSSFDVSGAQLEGTCGGWASSSSGARGFAMDGDGRFVEPPAMCDVFRPVACCATP